MTLDGLKIAFVYFFTIMEEREYFCGPSQKVMWSIANEPVSFLPSAGNYFAEVDRHTRALCYFRKPFLLR